MQENTAPARASVSQRVEADRVNRKRNYYLKTPDIDMLAHDAIAGMSC